jgi:hypothetical protein
VLLQENALLQIAAHTRAMLEHWELFGHPPHSSDLARNDNHLLTCPKNWLRSQHFNSIVSMVKLTSSRLSQHRRSKSVPDTSLTPTTTRSRAYIIHCTGSRFFPKGVCKRCKEKRHIQRYPTSIVHLFDRYCND